MAKPLHPLHIFRASSKLSASSVVGFGLALLVNLMIGRYLTPDEMGIFAIVTVWTFYSQLVRPGLLSAASRDVPHLLGAGEEAEARRVQNVALTGELLFSVVPFIAVCFAAFLYEGRLIRGAFLIAAAAMILTSAQSTLSSMFYVHGRFEIVTRLRFLLAIVGPAGILLTIRKLGIYSLLAMPGVAAACALVLVWKHRHVLGFHVAWNGDLAVYLMRVGAPFSLLTIVSWGYFMSDRPALIAAGLPLAVIGYYTFASNLIRSVAQVFWDFTAVLQPLFWTEIGRQGSVAAVTSQLTSVWVPYTAVTCAAASFGQALFGAIVRSVAPRFEPSVPVFEVLVFILVFYNASQLPSLVLNSKRVGKQNAMLVLWTAGLLLNVILLYALARVGMGIRVIAAASMLIDTLVVVAGFFMSHKYLFGAEPGAGAFYGWQAGCAAVAIVVYIVLQLTPMQYGRATPVWLTATVRIAVALAAWLLVGFRIWRWWIVVTEREADAALTANEVAGTVPVSR